MKTITGKLHPEIQRILGGPARVDSRTVDPGKLTVTYGKIPNWVREYSSVQKPVAMTIGYHLWFVPEGYNWHNLFHEIKHADQFKELEGKPFMREYTAATLLHGYKQNPFEEEAEKFAEKMTEKVKQ